MNAIDRLRELTRNLHWTWHPEAIEIFRDLDPEAWRGANHNPITFLEELPPEKLKENSRLLALEARITQAFHRLKDYLGRQNTWGARHAGPLRAFPVAYFSTEFGLHESLPIYSGGLGVLAGDHLKACSDLDIPLVGVGLFYAEGYFNQHLDSDGRQQEEYFAADVHSLPLEEARDSSGNPVRISLHTRSSELKARVWVADVGRNRLVLLDSNVEDNSEEDRALTSQLYGGGDGVRIRQELLLGAGGLRALDALGIRPGILHLNEGHSAFAILEQARRMMQQEGRSFGEVRERTAARVVFTTHTPVEAGHDRFSPDLVEETIGPLRDELGLSQKDLLALGRKQPSDDSEPFCMTILGLRMARMRNAVSSIHGSVSRAMWKELWPGTPEDEVPIGHITNGVHIPSWLAIPMNSLYERNLGEGWSSHRCSPDVWQAVDRIDVEEFWEQHQLLKAGLIDFVRRRVKMQNEKRNEGNRKCDGGTPCLDPAVLTIGFARRFALYKRPDLLLRDPGRLDRLVNHPETPVQIIFSGKAHPDDEKAQDLIQKVFHITRDERFNGKIVFIENHDINVARHLAQGVDLWLNTPRRPNEACGTSGQKVLLNGGLNASTLDGWWAQAYDGLNGFAVGGRSQHSDTARQDELDARALFELLEKEIVPLYYDRDEDGIPRRWLRRQMHAVKTLAPQFCARRMVEDYVLKCYLPAIGAATSSLPGREHPHP